VVILSQKTNWITTGTFSSQDGQGLEIKEEIKKILSVIIERTPREERALNKISRDLSRESRLPF